MNARRTVWRTWTAALKERMQLSSMNTLALHHWAFQLQKRVSEINMVYIQCRINCTGAMRMYFLSVVKLFYFYDIVDAVHLASVLPRKDFTSAESHCCRVALEKETDWSKFGGVADLRSQEESQASSEGCGLRASRFSGYREDVWLLEEEIHPRDADCRVSRINLHQRKVGYPAKSSVEMEILYPAL